MGKKCARLYKEFKVYPITSGKPWKDFKQGCDIISVML